MSNCIEEIRILGSKVEALRHESVVSFDEIRFLLIDRLDRLEAILNPPRIAKVVFVVTIGGMKLEITEMQLKVTNKLPLSLKLVDKFGNEAWIDGLPLWALTNPAMGSLAVATDGMSAVLTPVGVLGSFAVQVSADADMGEGVKVIIGNLPIDLLPGDATEIQIVSGEPILE